MSTVDDFSSIRSQYQQARNVQRQLIINKLKKEGWRAPSTGGRYDRQGAPRYTSSDLFTISHDLTHWKWIVAHKNDVSLLIDFQPLEQDATSHNIHALVDRIAITLLHDPECMIINAAADTSILYNEICAAYHITSLVDKNFVKQTISPFELPLTSDELNDLYQFIESIITELL